MTPEQWGQIRPILESALELDASRRSAYLDAACPDASLRREVEALVSSSEKAGSAYLAPQAKHGQTLSAGTNLGEYEIRSLLGAGGMGEVYVAHDDRLDRDVAIKILPEALAANEERLRRFEQEARATAALNHPNILAVFQMGTYEGAPYLVSELLDGENFRQRLERGALPVNKIADYCSQIALGLSAAHEKGIVHRDLKPENLFITRDDRVKILDFGLAKLLQTSTNPQDTLTTMANQTGAGVLLGTVGYMSPEQVRGDEVDLRTDIFSFGCVLYEMATGQQPFAGSTPAVILSQILEHDPAPAIQLNPKLPASMQAVIEKATEKDRELRYQHASEIRADLQRLKRDTDSARVQATKVVPLVHRKRWMVILPAILVIVAVATGTYFYFHRTPKLTEKDTVVLSDFSNATNDPVFDDALKQALAVSLGQSPFLNVLSDDKVRRTLQLMTRPPNTHLTPEITQELCLRAGSKAWIGGSIASVGSQYVVGLKVVNCSNGETLAQSQVTAANKERVLDALGEATTKLRAKLGESLTTVKKFDLPLSQQTTTSLEALKAQSIGNKMLWEKGTMAAMPFFEHAIELDPNFASAYLHLGAMYANVGQGERANELFKKAYSLRDHASEWERYDIESMYYEGVTGDLESATRVYREWLGSYPSNSVALGNLANLYALKGQFEQSLELHRQANELSLDDVIGYENLSTDQMDLNHFDDSRKTIQRAFDRKLESESLHYSLYSLAFLNGDERAMAEQVSWFDGKPESMPNVLSLESSAEGYFGRLGKARDFSKRAAESAERAGNKENATSWRLDQGLREAFFGTLESARKTATLALGKSNRGQSAEESAALIFSRVGDTAQAISLVEDLAKRFPQNTLVQSVVVPTVRAQIELVRKNPEKSIDLLRTAAPYELGYVLNSCIYAAYLRGEAYLAEKQGAAAAAEFQKIIDHRGHVVSCETGALAHLGLGRAYALQGDTVKARAAYQDFITLWKDADPDVPIFIAAKAEFARLQ